MWIGYRLLTLMQDTLVPIYTRYEYQATTITREREEVVAIKMTLVLMHKACTHPVLLFLFLPTPSPLFFHLPCSLCLLQNSSLWHIYAESRWIRILVA